MAKEDRNGCLHSETNGRFIRKTDAEKRKDAEKIYNTHGHLNYLEPLKQLKHTEREPVPLDKGKKAWIDPEFDIAPNIITGDNREYRAKFDVMSDDPTVSQKYYEIAQEILNHRDGTNGEDLYVYDVISGEIQKSTIGNVAYHPEYSAELENWIIEHRGGLVAFHNHAKNCPPSIDDLHSAIFHGYSKGYVLCHNGQIYEDTKPSQSIDNEMFYTLYLECKSNDETEKMLYAYSQLIEYYGCDFTIKEITNG